MVVHWLPIGPHHEKHGFLPQAAHYRVTVLSALGDISDFKYDTRHD